MTTEVLNRTPLRSRLAELPGATLLRRALVADAAVTGLNGAVYLVAASLVDGPLGLEASLLQPAGAFLLAFTAALLYLASRTPVPAAGARAIVAGNAAWALASIAVLAAGAIEPTAGGAAWVVLQAGVVAGFAALQAYALRRAG